MRSNKRAKIGVMDIGLKSQHSAGLGTLAIGVITACFHCVGILPLEIERLKMCAIGSAMK